METLYTILLIVSAIIVIIGIIRLFLDSPRNTTDFFLQLFLLDWMGDVLEAILKAIGNNDDSW